MKLGRQRHVPADLPLEETSYPLYRRLGVTQGRNVCVLKISSTPGFDSRTAQPVAIRFTDCVIQANK